MARSERFRWMARGGRIAHQSLVLQKFRIRRQFPSLSVRVRGDRLLCVGSVCPVESGCRYRFELTYRYGSAPEVRILRPHIEPSPDIHMYKDGTLCLYYWHEQPWKTSHQLHDTLLPWIAEWVLFYEGYQLTGRWLGPEAEHGTAKMPQRRLS